MQKQLEQYFGCKVKIAEYKNKLQLPIFMTMRDIMMVEIYGVNFVIIDVVKEMDMPKIQIITDQKSIEKYGGSKMYFAPPIDYDKVMKKIPYGKVITVGKIREYFAELNGADFTEPITAGVFVSIVAWAS